MPTGRKVALTGVFGLALVYVYHCYNESYPQMSLIRHSGFAGSIARMIIYLKIVASKCLASLGLMGSANSS